MKSRCLDRQIKFLLLCVVVLGVVRSQPAYGQASTPVSVEAQHLGDTSHLEFKGREAWVYDVKREKQGSTELITITVPKLDATSITQLKAFSTPLIERVIVGAGVTDEQTQIQFQVKDKDVQSFDYQTDQPSRLVVDFFVQSKETTPKEVAQKPKEKTKVAAQNRSRIFKIRSKAEERKPAADFTPGPLRDEEADDLTTGSFEHGIFDGADPNFDRFRVKDYEIKEAALIASQQNIYLHFPMLHLEAKPLQNIIQNPPVYEISPEENDENLEARFLQRLFEKKRYATFQKTLKFFDKKHPESKYNEMLHYMAADINYTAWRESEKPEDFEKAMESYREMLVSHPDSPLFERTSLLVGYSYLDHGDYIGTLREFQKFLTARPNSSFRDHAKIAIAEAYAGLSKFDEAVATLQDVQKNPSKPKFAIEASYRIGDVAFQKHDYAAAFEAYKQALQKYPDAWGNYPNAFFNSAESLFWTNKYRESLDAYREYLRRYPTHEHGGYAMTRLGELMEILGVDQRRVMGAFLESYFRYSSTPGGKLARVRLISQRLKNMKPKEMQKALEETAQITAESNLPEMPEFVTVVTTDGLYRRGEYDAALERLIHFYQTNPSSKDLGFIRNRIVRNITQQIRSDVDKGDFIAALRDYSRYSNTWLKNADRIDVRYYTGRAYEQAGVFKEAANVYRETLNRIYSLEGTPLQKERSVFEILPSTDTLNLRLAAAHLQEGDFAKSLNHLQQIKSSEKLDDKEKIERVEIAAQIAERTGHTQEAIRYLAKLVETWSGKPQLVADPLLRLAEMYNQSGDVEKAQIALSRILNLQTDTKLVSAETHAKALELRGDLFLKEKKTDSAIESYQALLETYEKKRPLSSVRYRVGELEFKRGNVKEAEKIWGPLEGSQNKVWYQMAQEQLRNEQFRDDYKKYMDRIPAMADAKEGK